MNIHPNWVFEVKDDIIRTNSGKTKSKLKSNSYE